jgi:hypothetical protein
MNHLKSSFSQEPNMFVLRKSFMLICVLQLTVVSFLNSQTRLAAEEDPFDVEYISDNGGMLIAVKPAKICRNQDIAPFAEFMNTTGRFKESFGFGIEEVEQFIITVNDPHEQMSSLFLRTERKLDWKKYCAGFAGGLDPETLETAEYKGEKILEIPARREKTFVFWQPTPNSIVGSSREEIEKLIDHKVPGRQLLDIKQWNQLQNRDLVIVMDTAMVDAMRRDIDRQGANPFFKMLEPLLENGQHAVLGVNVGSELDLKAIIECKEASGARDAETSVKEIIEFAKVSVRMAANQPMDEPFKPIAKQGLKTLTQLLDVLNITRSGKEITLTSTVSVEGMGAIVLAPAMEAAQIAAHRTQSANNGKQMGLALHNYFATHQKLPPAVIVGPKGHPHSWRIALLPFIDPELAADYKLDEPWDSKSNLVVMKKMPEAFRHPNDPKDSTNASYFAISGPDTVFSDLEGISLRDITDGTSNTILFVEAKRDIPWTKPEDLIFDPEKELPEFGGYFAEGFNAVFADGSVQFVSNQVAEEDLLRLIQRSDESKK